MKKIDAIWLVEHAARELDVACAVKSILAKKYSINLEIRNFYLHIKKSLNEFNPKLVIHPFFYFNDSVTANYVQRWPNATHFNLAWEQIFYQGNKDVKAPHDDFSKKKVIHHAWGQFFKKFLMTYEVPQEHIFVNGNPSYQLYLEPYKNYFKTREQLAARYHINPTHKWIFIPENYRWAFITDKDIAWRATKGGNLNEMHEMKEFCQKSLTTLLKWCATATKNQNISIIFRPKPANKLSAMREYYQKAVGDIKPDNLQFIKNETVREWILASDVIISSFSTTLIESAIANKPIFMVEPLPLIKAFSNDWYKYINKIGDEKKFLDACNSTKKNNNDDLKVWAKKEMLNTGDPINNLASYIHLLIKAAPTQKNINQWKKFFIYKNYINAFKYYFLNKKEPEAEDHENDNFNEQEILQKVQIWDRIIQ